MERTLYWETRNATQEAGRRLGQLLREGDTVALVGDLGTGKTTLTQGIAQGMGIREPVQSPTFTLVQEYRGKPPLFHCDPYRLETAEDLALLGFEEYYERGGVVVMEWADKVESLLPEDRLTLLLCFASSVSDFGEDAPRQCRAVASGVRSQEILNMWVGESADA